jgi:proliferating cell nuclear antigen
MSEAQTEPIYEGMMLPAGLSLPTVHIDEYPDIPEEAINETPAAPEIKATLTPEATITQVLKCVMTASQYHEISKSLASLVPECRMHISVLGLKVLAVDNANVAMVLYDQYANSFETFETATQKDIGIDIKKWLTFGKNVQKKSFVCFDVMERQEPPTKEGKPGAISHRYTLSSGGTVQTFTGLDTNTIRRDPNPPTITLNTSFLIHAGTFIEAIKTCKTVSDKIEFSYDGKDNLTAIAQGDTDKMVKQILFNQSIGPAFNSLFSLDYLVDIAKAIQNKKEVLEVSFNTDRPIRIKLVNSEREIVFLLAPRIQAD